MKNIHLIPTDKPSRLRIGNNGNFVLGLMQSAIISKNDSYTNQNIYITSDEEIKEGDWIYDLGTKYIKIKQSWENSHLDFNGKKIILTTDQDLDGVQSIDDEFLEWFVENPGCEYVEVATDAYTMQEIFELKLQNGVFKYKIIIPKKEPLTKLQIAKNIAAIGIGKPKQETLEEAAELNAKKVGHYAGYQDFITGAKWQQERMYSEEEVIAFAQWMYDYKGDINKVEELLKQFKKK